MGPDERAPDATGLVVVRCVGCGDTFPIHEGDVDAVCPSCGGEEHEPAAEPLL